VTKELEKVATTVEHRLSDLETKVDGLCDEAKAIKVWVLGIFASVIITVIGLVLHHVLTNPGTAAKLALKTLLWIL